MKHNTQLHALLKPTGPYTVGTCKIDVFDQNRPELGHPQGRLIPIQVYFPLEQGEHIPYPKILEGRIPQKFLPLNVLGYSKPSSTSALKKGEFPLVLMNHGSDVALTDYAILMEDLASHGFVAISLQHQLATDLSLKENRSGRSVLKHGQVIENILCVFEWLEENNRTLFNQRLNTHKIALMGHSMGANAALLLASRVAAAFRPKPATLFPRQEKAETVNEAIIILDGEFPCPSLSSSQFPILFCLSEERKAYQEERGTLDFLKRMSYPLKHYTGTKHISFMDHGLVLEDENYFNGTTENKIHFYQSLRQDIFCFLKEQGIE